MKLIEKIFPAVTATADMGWADYEKQCLDSLREESLAWAKNNQKQRQAAKDKTQTKGKK